MSPVSATIISRNMNNCVRFKHYTPSHTAHVIVEGWKCVNNCTYKMRTTRIQSDVKNLLFDCLLHQLGCCYASTKKSADNKFSLVVIFSCIIFKIRYSIKRELKCFMAYKLNDKTFWNFLFKLSLNSAFFIF